MNRIQIALTAVAITVVIVVPLALYENFRHEPMHPQVVEIWKKLPSSESGCFDFDYWPDGGMYTIYCHLKPLMSYQGLQKGFGGSIFVSGPHSPTELNLESETEFGHYNPKFVKWMKDKFIPRDDRLVDELRPIFQEYLQDNAILYMRAIERLEAFPKEFEAEVQHYRHYMSTPNKLSTARPLDKLTYFFPSEYYSAPAFAFWVRRRIDGTDQVFKEALEELLSEFAPDQLEKIKTTDWEKYKLQNEPGESDYAVEGEIDGSGMEFDNSTASEVLTNLWTSIGETRNRCPSQFDYFPEGGLRVYFCHALDVVSLSDFRDLLKHDIYLSGPHSKDSLDLDNASEFGRYNPKFVRWLVDSIIPKPDDEEFISRTKVVFDQHIGLAARSFYLVRHMAATFPTEYKSATASYLNKIQAGDAALPYFEDFSNTMYQLWDGDMRNKIDSNFTTTALTFWMRREQDGTDALFAEGLNKLIKAYDPAFITTVSELNLTNPQDATSDY